MAKVLIPMKRPEGTDHRDRLPLLIYWNPLGPQDCRLRQDQVEGGHLFKMTHVTYEFGFPKPHSWKINPKFNELWVFSVSSYLRSIKKENSGQLRLTMPNAFGKIRALSKLVRVAPETH